MTDSWPAMPAVSGTDNAIRAALKMAIVCGDRIVLLLRDKATTSAAMARSVEGTPVGIVTGPDGRERVFLEVAEGTQQMVLVERIARIMPTSL